MKTKMGSYKIIFNVFQFDEHINISVDIADIDFTGFKVKSIKTVYENIINTTSEVYDSDVYNMNNDLKTIFKMNEVNLQRSKKYIVYGSNYSFTEKLTLPKLSSAEAQKSLNLELSKIYPDYTKKYVYDVLHTNIDKTTVYRGLFISKKYFIQITDLFKELKTNFESVTICSNAIRRAMVRDNIFNKKKKVLFVDILADESIIVSYNGESDNGSIITNSGYNNLKRNISKYLDITEEEFNKKLKENYNFKADIPDKEYEEIVGESYKDLLVNIKRMIGYFYVDSLYDNIYCNIESSYKLGYNELEDLLRVEFSEFKKPTKNIFFNNLISSGAMLKVTPNDYKLPIKVKKYDDKPVSKK